eukprot:gnl/Spiro4/4939_TR2463_c0_g1_i1.p1 gnl/Spiro4/4939_TR2463_c0_g1~~gnl/Spiro4/4939_TR2463_c0_g1_i1.p1  ORF type:complete len:145 (-),score=41.78 gnl/Spiro4/4939_TR2463_c0_g1_i1:61-468(-)
MAEEQEWTAETALSSGNFTFQTRPNHAKKFRASDVREAMQAVLNDKFRDPNACTYNENTPLLVRSIADDIKTKLKDLDYDRYKFVVQVFIGEMRGQQVKMAMRCFWDPQTDNFAKVDLMNDQIYCVAVAFGLYLY